MSARSFDPRTVTQNPPHVRDALNLRGLSRWQLTALAPCLFMALYNTGLQVCRALAPLELEGLPGWRGALLARLGGIADPDDALACLLHGSLFVGPLFLVIYGTGELWQRLFAVRRGRSSSEGTLVTALLFTLILPAGLPLWQAVLGITFGVVIGKEVFGGTGRNLLHPALTGLVFLTFAYPNSWRGGEVWTPVPGWMTREPAARAAAEGMVGLEAAGVSFGDTFLGTTEGALGETSALACLLGAVVLLLGRLISWRILVGAALGLAAGTAALAARAGADGPYAGVPWFWQFTLGSFAFGVVFLATDPVTSPLTDRGRWIYGLLIGALTAVLRFLHPTLAESALFAIFFASLSAPLIDHAVVWLHTRRRARQHG